MTRVKRGKDARSALLKGIDAVADTVKITLGPAARTVIYRSPKGAPIVIDDGVSIVNQIHLEDPFQDLGASLMRQIAGEAQKASGDGTTTACVIAQAMAHEANTQIISQDLTPIQLKREIDTIIESVVAYILDEAEPAVMGQLRNVATISANGDEPLGDVISEAFSNVGDGGIVVVEESLDPGPTLEMIEGMEVMTGAASPHLLNGAKEQRFDNALVLCTDETISQFQELIPALEVAQKEKRPLVVYCAAIKPMALQNLCLNVVQGNINCCVCELPGYAQDQTDICFDISERTGAYTFIQNLGDRIADLKIEGDETPLGTASITITNTQSIIISEHEPSEDWMERLELEMKNADHPWSAEKIANRIARIKGQIAVIKVGATTQAELYEKKARIDDAINATRAALKGGVIPGGGMMLVKGAWEYCLSDPDATGSLTPAKSVVFEGLTAPLNQIVKNSGRTEEWAAIIAGGMVEKNEGWDAKENEISDPMAGGIIDPALVVINSLKAATSIVGLLLTTEAVVVGVDNE